MNIKNIDFWLKSSAQMAPHSQDATYHRLGHAFSNNPLSVSDRAKLAPMLSHIHKFRVGECYMNSGLIALAQESLKFCEGVAAGMWPVNHAWVAFKGRAIDVTWPISWEPGRKATSARFTPSDKADVIMRRVLHNLKTCTYWGIEIPRPVLKAHFLEYKHYMPLFDPTLGRRWPEYEQKIFWSSTIKATRALAGIV
jgi:hypothetical protein